MYPSTKMSTGLSPCLPPPPTPQRHCHQESELAENGEAEEFGLVAGITDFSW